MSKTHYQAPWIDAEESRSFCNEMIERPLTSIFPDDVDCMRCLKMIDTYRDRGKRSKRPGLLARLLC